ncbi:MAG TPA: DNA cytosine methyltransferase [Fluviicola sp.]|nr:DNA cytosine methyltransferase [Fluviicola sp.]
MQQEKPIYIDLFAGCGGLSLGLHNAGWKGLFAVEKSPDAFQTLKHNLIDKKDHFNWPSWLGEPSNLEIDQLIQDHHENLVSLRGKVDLVVGGPPCQGFSTAGRRKENDLRNNLINSYLRFIARVQPKMILFENVKGFTQKFEKNKSKGMAYSQFVVRALRLQGYDVKGQMVDFSKFGVPQKRTRFILVGIKKEIAKEKNITAEVFFEKLVENKFQFCADKSIPQNPSVEDAISDLLKSNGTVPTTDRKGGFLSGLYSESKSDYQVYLRKGSSEEPAGHSFPKHKTEIIERFKKYLLEPRGKNLSKEAKEKLGVKKNVIIPLAADQPTPTITTLPDDYIHYLEPRILTVREYARIQSFPDWYEFQGKYTTGGERRTKEVPRYTQIGNAIPPLFGEQAGLVLKSVI